MHADESDHCLFVLFICLISSQRIMCASIFVAACQTVMCCSNHALFARGFTIVLVTVHNVDGNSVTNYPSSTMAKTS